MKKTNLLLFALFPAFLLTSCGLKGYAENYKLITDTLNIAKEKTDILDDNLAYRKTFTSKIESSSFATIDTNINKPDGSTASLKGKITDKLTVKFENAIFESTGDVLHGKIDLSFIKFIKDTTNNGDENQETQKANDSVPEDETKPDGEKPIEPETNPDPETPTEPDANPDPETPTEPETNPEEETEAPDIKKGIKTVGELSLETYLFDIDNETFCTLKGGLFYSDENNQSVNFRHYNQVPRLSVKDIIDDYKSATSAFYGLLPEPKAEKEPEQNDGIELAKATTVPIQGYENSLTGVQTSNKDDEVFVRYTHTKNQKPLIPGNTDSKTTSLNTKFVKGLITLAKSKYVQTINKMDDENGKLNRKLTDESSYVFEPIETIEAPKLIHFEKSEAIDGLLCKEIFSFFNFGTSYFYNKI